MFPFGNMLDKEEFMNKKAFTLAEVFSPYFLNQRKIAFTLAEVLITLGIIGVVAAMTLPAIIQKKNEIETVTKLKKSYSVLNQAFKMAEVKYGDISDWAEWNDAEVILDKYIIPEIRGVKKYGKATNSKLALCYEPNFKLHNPETDNSSQYTWMDGVYISSPFFTNKTASFKLNDGSCIGLNPNTIYDNSRYHYNIMIDINGVSGPNIAGEDLFFFTIHNNVLRPFGYDWSSGDITSTKNNACNRKAALGGYTCAARIMSEGWEIKY